MKEKMSKFEFPLINKKDPNLLREIFPYTEVSTIPFNNYNVELKLPNDFWITDTTFRDGQQARPPYTVEQMVTIFDFLHRLAGRNGLIRQTEFFLYSPKDKEAVRKCQERGYRFPEVTGWIRATAEDFKLVKEMGLAETGILTSCSDYHIYLKLNADRQKAMDKYLAVVKEALNLGIIPRCHLEDITRADFFGFVIPFVQQLMLLSEESGIPVKIRACDTMGFGVPYTNVSVPVGVPQLIKGLQTYGGVPSELLEWHGHNDFHKVHINGVTAWLSGCAAINGSILGFGERTGNSPVEALVMEYIMLSGKSDDIDTLAITDIARYFEKELHYHVPANYPLVGADFNVTRAGIHADGALKNEEIYNIFDTEKILGRKIGVAITDKSGIAGILYWINDHISSVSQQLDKKHPGIARIYKWINNQYEEHERLTSISNEEMHSLVRKYIPELFESNLTKARNHAKELMSELIESLSEEASFSTMNIPEQEVKLQKLVNDNPFIQFAYTVGKDGKRLTKNITQIQYMAKYDYNMSTLTDFYDRQWFINSITTGKTTVTDFYNSRITNALCITVSTPIRDSNMEIVGVLGVDIQFEDLLKLAEDEYIS